MTICFYNQRRLISVHEGRLEGVRLKQRVIRSIMPGENLSFGRIGLRVESNTGASNTSILCTKNPKNQTSIFQKLNFIKLSTNNIFSFSSGEKQSMPFFSYRIFLDEESVIKIGSPRCSLLLWTKMFFRLRQPKGFRDCIVKRKGYSRGIEDFSVRGLPWECFVERQSDNEPWLGI